MLYLYKSYQYKFIPVPTCSSVFVYMIPDTSSLRCPLVALYSFTWYRYEMLYWYKSYRYEFIPVPTCSSLFIYMIPIRNVVLVQVIPVRVHPSAHLWLAIRLHDTDTKCCTGTSHTGTSLSQCPFVARYSFTWYRYEMLYSYKSGTGSECLSILNNAPKWLVRTSSCHSGKMTSM